MKIAIRYYSKTGNTKKLAEEIGAALKIPAEDVSQPLTEDVDVLFLGSAVYAAGVDSEVKTFIQNINVKVGKVVNISTAALLPSTYKQVKKLVEQKGLMMAKEEFHCRGAFQMMHKNRPNAEDLKAVVAFAKNVVE
jgi:flavodoxin